VSGVQGWSVEGFHHVQLGMPPGGEPEAEDFYSELLGFTRIQKPAHLAARGGCWFRSGQVELHLGAEPGFVASKKAHPALRVRGLASVRAALGAADWPVQDDTQLDGHDRWYALDPFGNRLEFIEER
jgi:catechol 2,3-dioxygenase-like lactoylglutathione lyase family enzyme